MGIKKHYTILEDYIKKSNYITHQSRLIQIIANETNNFKDLKLLGEDGTSQKTCSNSLSLNESHHSTSDLTDNVQAIAKRYYEKLSNIQFPIESESSGSSEQVATGDGIMGYVNISIGAINDNIDDAIRTEAAYFIAPINFGFNSDTNIQNIVKHICLREIDGELINDLYGNKPLDKPIIVISNTQTVKGKHSADIETSGGSHWVSLVLFPKRYETLSNNKIENDKYRVYFFDSLGAGKIPESLKQYLTEGGEWEEESFSKLNKIKVKPFCSKEDLDVIDINHLTVKQNNSYDCGWWAVYHSLMAVYTGGVEFLDEIKGKCLSAKPLRDIMQLQLEENELKKQIYEEMLRVPFNLGSVSDDLPIVSIQTVIEEEKTNAITSLEAKLVGTDILEKLSTFTELLEKSKSNSNHYTVIEVLQQIQESAIFEEINEIAILIYILKKQNLLLPSIVKEFKEKEESFSRKFSTQLIYARYTFEYICESHMRNMQLNVDVTDQSLQLFEKYKNYFYLGAMSFSKKEKIDTIFQSLLQRSYDRGRENEKQQLDKIIKLAQKNQKRLIKNNPGYEKLANFIEQFQIYRDFYNETENITSTNQLKSEKELLNLHRRRIIQFCNEQKEALAYLENEGILKKTFVSCLKELMERLVCCILKKPYETLETKLHNELENSFKLFSEPTKNRYGKSVVSVNNFLSTTPSSAKLLIR